MPDALALEMSALADRVIDQALLVRRKELKLIVENPALTEGYEEYEVILHTEVYMADKDKKEELGQVIFVGTKEKATECAMLTRAIFTNTLARFLHARELILQRQKSLNSAVNAVMPRTNKGRRR